MYKRIGPIQSGPGTSGTGNGPLTGYFAPLPLRLLADGPQSQAIPGPGPRGGIDDAMEGGLVDLLGSRSGVASSTVTSHSSKPAAMGTASPARVISIGAQRPHDPVRVGATTPSSLRECGPSWLLSSPRQGEIDSPAGRAWPPCGPAGWLKTSRARSGKGRRATEHAAGKRDDTVGLRSPRFPAVQISHAPSTPSRLVRRSRLLFGRAGSGPRGPALTLVVGSPGAGQDRPAGRLDWRPTRSEQPRG